MSFAWNTIMQFVYNPTTFVRREIMWAVIFWYTKSFAKNNLKQVWNYMFNRQNMLCILYHGQAILCIIVAPCGKEENFFW
jgi:hypothetical protein